ncbi:hypothetical protein [Anaerosporobacter sp.]|uniref:hypothetical protein n=1 Tax=Anaerosporobacter sp. TaxID=1872529 RepID=UPI00286F3E07|nr:hypothetical protein [Anaerosporobacter sp.]
MYGDYTGYEAFCNEIRVKDFIEIPKINSMAFLLNAMEALKQYLETNFSKHSFTIIGSLEDTEINLRFHKIRQEEESWLSEDIDSYSEAIIVYTIISNIL